MPDPQQRAVSLLVEGVVVLVSILAAFFLEGWRADRELARDLTQELASVRVELERNRELVDAELQSLHRVETAGIALEGILASVEARQVTVPDTLALLAIQWTPSFSPSLGAVNALISSGRLAQVEVTPLRLGLAGLASVIDDALEEELFARQIAVEQLLPLLGEESEWRIVTELARAYFGLDGSAGRGGLTPQERARGRPFPGVRALTIPNSQAVRSALGRRTTWIAAARAEFTGLGQHLDDLIAQVPVAGGLR